jgi:hypothetical protein
MGAASGAPFGVVSPVRRDPSDDECEEVPAGIALCPWQRSSWIRLSPNEPEHVSVETDPGQDLERISPRGSHSNRKSITKHVTSRQGVTTMLRSTHEDAPRSSSGVSEDETRRLTSNVTEGSGASGTA